MIYRYRRSIGDIGYGFLAAYVVTIVGSVLYRAVTRSFDFWDGVRRFVQMPRDIAQAAPCLTALIVGFPALIFFLWRLLMSFVGKPGN